MPRDSELIQREEERQKKKVNSEKRIQSLCLRLCRN